MATNKKQKRDDDFGVWLAQNYGSMSRKESEGKRNTPVQKPPAKKSASKKK